MRTALLLTTALLGLAPAARAEPPASWQPRLLSAAEAKADVALLRRGLETIHPGLTRYTSKPVIDAAFARLEGVASKPVTDLALHGAIAEMVAAIHCDHSKPEMSDAMTRFRETTPTHLPFRFKLIEGRMIVVSTDGQAGAPPMGAEILTMNGLAVPVLMNRLAPLVAYDGATDQAIAVKLGDDSDLMGDDFNEYHPALFGMSANWRIGWKTVGASTGTQTVLTPIDFARWRRLDAPDGAFRREFYNGVTWRMAGKTARLKIDTFVNYRNPVQPTVFLGGFFKAMQAAGTEHLILDLRANGGGSEDVSIALGRWLFDRPFTWSKPIRYKAIRYGDLPKHIVSWGDREALFNPPEGDFVRVDGWYDRKPGPAVDETDDDISTFAHLPVATSGFRGRLTILTGPQNGSGATRTIAMLKEKRGALLVGEDSSGSAEGPTAGEIFLMTLPNSGLKVRIPNAWNRTNIDHFLPGLGVPADVQVVPTLADFQAGRDRALEVARDGTPAVADPAAALAGLLTGAWRGTLEYRDYGTDDRVVLPARLASDGIVLAWTFDDGPGKIVRTRERWTVEGGQLIVREGKSVSRAGIMEFRTMKDGSTTLVLDGRARENGADVMVRTILTAAGDRLRISRMSRSAGTSFLLRHSYELVRDAAGGLRPQYSAAR